MLISEPDMICVPLESSETLKLSFRPATLKLKVLLLEMTMGRTFKLCDAIGVRMKLSESGIMMGPPQL